MKLKLASLGLLALAPLAAQAEMVEMQDTELADVQGQAGLAGNFNYDFQFGWSNDDFAGYAVDKTVYGSNMFGSPRGSHGGGSNGGGSNGGGSNENGFQGWYLGTESNVISSYTDKFYEKNLEFGKRGGANFINFGVKFGSAG